MTLTLETAKHAINKYGRVIDIVDDADPLSAYSVNREQAIEANKLEYPFTPCIVVTTAREALEAAWELAHEPEDGVIPVGSAYLLRSSRGDTPVSSSAGTDLKAINGMGERRLLDPPEPEPEPTPEPWELSRFCYADGDIYERFQDDKGDCWMRTAEHLPHHREDLAKLNPKPLDLE